MVGKDSSDPGEKGAGTGPEWGRRGTVSDFHDTGYGLGGIRPPQVSRFQEDNRSTAMSPVSRTIAALALIAVAGLGLSALLIAETIDRLRVRVVETNIDFVLTQLRQSVEASVGLGLELNEIRIAQDLVERARIGNRDILAVEIFDPVGVSVYNTDRGSIGEPVIDDWLEAIRLRDHSRRWRLEQSDIIVFGEEIQNNFGEPVGQVAVQLSGDAHVMASGSPLETILPRFGALVLPAALITVLCALLAFSLATADLRAVARQLGGTGKPLGPGDPEALEKTALAMNAAIEAKVEQVEAATAEVHALDESEDADEPA